MIPKDIQDIKFTKVMGGYKADEVDDFCDKVYDDYIQFTELVKAKQQKIEQLQKQIEENENSAKSINTVLISAQKLADSILAEANAKAEETVANANNEAENIKQRTKKALEEIDAVITEQKKEAAKEAEIMLSDAARKSEGMILAAKDSVAREQILFDKLKAEVASFKKEIKIAYKAHLESLSALPEEVPVTPEEAAIGVEEIIRNEPDLRQFIERHQTVEEAVTYKSETAEEESVKEGEMEAPVLTVEDTKVAPPLREVMNDMSAGFIVTPIDEEE